MVLGIETSDLLCSVAFAKNNQVLVEYNHEIPKQHASMIGTLVEKGGNFLLENNLLSKNYIDGIELIAVAIGPGSFTGLRIGLSYAQGLCLGRDIPIVGINNHQVLAENCPIGLSSVFTIINAHRDEVFLAKMNLNDKEYFEIESHVVIDKKNLVDEINEKSALIYNINFELDKSIINALIKKRIIINSAQYSAAAIAKMGYKQYQQSGGDNLSEIEPLYIRPFAGVQ
jgi:tRNA threonylcarbamoyladenosine biosynthesis protein TsaB